MKILKDELFKEEPFSLSTQLNFGKEVVNDALVKGIGIASVNLQSFNIEEDEISLNIKVNVNIDYLDARTLESLELPLTFEENILFTTSIAKEKEADIDLIVDYLDLYELIYQLIVVNIPFNYSQSEKTTNEKDFYDDNKPFTTVFNKKEEK